MILAEETQTTDTIVSALPFDATLFAILIFAGIVVGFIVATIIVAIVIHSIKPHRKAIKKHISLSTHFFSIVVFLTASTTTAKNVMKIPDEYSYAFSVLSTVLSIFTVITFAWLIVCILHLWEDISLQNIKRNYPGAQRTRNIKTQVSVLRRTIEMLVIAAGIFLCLWLMFPGLKSIGSTILASAGIASVVLGIAAQSTLSNIFSGLQIALTGSVRIDDEVKIGEDRGKIELITLTYVVVKVWDERRFIVPSNYFTSNIFENWSLKVDEMNGTIDIDLAWNVPIDQLRQVLKAILETEPLWDKRVGKLVISNAVNGYIRVQAIVSASKVEDLITLQSSVRERLVSWIQNNSRESTPGQRILPSKNDIRAKSTSKNVNKI